MRIGARLSGRVVRGVLTDGHRVLRQSTAEGARALHTVLRELGEPAPRRVCSVTLEVSDLLVEAVRHPRADLSVTPVSVLRVLPRTPQHVALTDHPSATLRSFVLHRATVCGGMICSAHRWRRWMWRVRSKQRARHADTVWAHSRWSRRAPSARPATRGRWPRPSRAPFRTRG